MLIANCGRMKSLCYEGYLLYPLAPFMWESLNDFASDRNEILSL